MHPGESYLKYKYGIETRDDFIECLKYCNFKRKDDLYSEAALEKEFESGELHDTYIEDPDFRDFLNLEKRGFDVSYYFVRNNVVYDGEDFNRNRMISKIQNRFYNTSITAAERVIEELALNPERLKIVDESIVERVKSSVSVKAKDLKEKVIGGAIMLTGFAVIAVIVSFFSNGCGSRGIY